MKRVLRILVILAILGSNISCDQVSKSIVRQRIQYNQQFGFIDNHLTLTKVENTGAFLSLGRSLPKFVKTILLTILPMIVLGLAFVYLLIKKSLSGFMIVGISFVVSGGAGNLYDRIVYGSVTDFLHIDFEIFQTGIFNMADVSIMTGIFMILFDSYLNRKSMKDVEVDKILE